MAITSMTGFGRGELEQGPRLWVAEIRCVNNRYLDLKMKLPRGYAVFEERLRRLVNDHHIRGRVDLYLSVTGDFSDLQEVRLNLELARRYQQALAGLAAEIGQEAHVTPQLLASFPDVLIQEQREEDVEQLWPQVQKVITGALAACATMRSQEGEALAADLRERLRVFSGRLAVIEQHIPELLNGRQELLQERLQKLLDNIQLDPLRLAQEVAILADKSDVTEELVRLRSHIGQFEMFLDENGGVGRKLDFLLQEFLREVNTLASKISDATIAHLTVDLKSDLEKMREQVQNIE